MVSRLQDYKEVLPKLIEKGIDCIEFHAISTDEKDVMDKWLQINDFFDGMLCISIDRSELGDKKLKERVQKMLSIRKPYTTIIQADGIAMSGSDDKYGTTLQAVATAQLFQNANFPAYIMMSGGTNTKSIELAHLCGVKPDCLAVGSYARKIVKEYLTNDNLLNDQNLINEAVKIAKDLVDTIVGKIMINLKTDNFEIDNIDTILFDKDGTFIDLHYFWGKMTEMRVLEIIKRFNLKEDLFSALCLKLGYDTLNGKMLKDGITAMYSRPVIIEIFCKDLNNLGVSITEFQIEEVFDEVSKTFYENMSEYTKPIENAINFIKLIKSKGIKTGIVTSDAAESTLLTLKHFHWERLFDVVIGRESTKETKESGIPVKLALEKLQSNPKFTVMIGDAPMDYLAAKNGGVARTILAATGQIDEETLLQTSQYTVSSLDEISIC